MLSAEQLRSLAEQQVFIGTSSWKYPGWCGQIYDEQRYLTRNKFSEVKFECGCLTEYAQTRFNAASFPPLRRWVELFEISREPWRAHTDYHRCPWTRLRVGRGLLLF